MSESGWLRRFRDAGYHSLAEVEDILLGWGATSIGESVDGRRLLRLELGPEDAEECSVLLAGIHAMEWIGVEVALTLLRSLQDATLKRKIIAFPIVNPDGYARVEESLRSKRFRFHRANTNGVDLNRNWSVHHRANLASRLRISRVVPELGHTGGHGRSEPEVDRLCASLENSLADGLRIERVLSLHSFGRKVLYPYGGIWAPPKAQKHHDVAKALEAQLPGYSAVQTSHWVPGSFAPGMELDHFCDRYDALSILVECGGLGVRKTVLSDWWRPFSWFNTVELEAEKRLLRGPLCAYLEGRPA